jgi:hypothetical protein
MVIHSHALTRHLGSAAIASAATRSTDPTAAPRTSLQKAVDPSAPLIRIVPRIVWQAPDAMLSDAAGSQSLRMGIVEMNLLITITHFTQFLSCLFYITSKNKTVQYGLVGGAYCTLITNLEGLK